MDLSRFVTKSGAAQIAGVNWSTIRRAVDRGELHVFTTAEPGSVELLKLQDVQEWAEQQHADGRRRRRGSAQPS